MAIFLDTGNIDEIKKFSKMGIVRGVTTNPSILLKNGVTGGAEGVKKRSIEIAKMIHPYPLSVEINNNDNADSMIKEAIEISKWADNIVIKIPFHGPNGELENIEVVHALEKQHNVRVNVTAIMSAQQCFLAAMSGASFVSIFCGRINNMGYDSREEVRRLRSLLEEFKLDAKIICASTREVLNIIEWLEAGGHIVTATPNLIEGMIVHPYTKETVQMFLKDAKKLG